MGVYAFVYNTSAASKATMTSVSIPLFCYSHKKQQAHVHAYVSFDKLNNFSVKIAKAMDCKGDGYCTQTRAHRV